MRYAILADNHGRTILATTTPPRLDNLIAGTLCNPVIVTTEVEDESGWWLSCSGGAPDVVAPFVACDSAHFVGGHVSGFARGVD